MVVRRSGENSLLDRVGQTSVPLTLNHIATVVGDALKAQRKDILGHVRRMVLASELKSAPLTAKAETRLSNLHARLTAIESELRAIKKGGLR